MKKIYHSILAVALMSAANFSSAAENKAADVYQEAYAVYVLKHPDTASQNSKTLLKQFSQDYAALFQHNKSVNQAQFIAYEQQQLHELMQKRRDMSLKQTYVRYGILDADKNQQLTLKEFQDIALKNFADYDKNADGVVNTADIKLAAGKGSETHDGFRVRLPIAMPLANHPTEFIRLYGKGKAYATLGDYLTGRDQQFFETDSNQDFIVSEQEYVNEFMQRYDRNTVSGLQAMQQLSARKFQTISAGKKTIQSKDIAQFAQKVDQAVSQ